MKIIIYRKDNGVGLTVDAKILTYFLQSKVDKVVVSDPDHYVEGDLALHLEIPCWKSLKTKTRNVMIPNQDWWLWPTDNLRRFDEIACKTYGGVRLFTQFNENTTYLGFTSRKRGHTGRRTFDFLHIAGKSALKGTQQVIDAWQPDYPDLIVIDAAGRFDKKNKKNVKYRVEYLTDQHLKHLQQTCLFHIQPSEIEGYGHVLGESNSTGNLLITTNAPPMNEFEAVKYVDYSHREIYNLGVRFKPDVTSIQKAVDYVLDLNYKEIVSYGHIAYERFLNDRKNFINNLYNMVERYGY